MNHKEELLRGLWVGTSLWLPWPVEISISGVAPHPHHELLHGDPSWIRVYMV